MSTTRIKVLGFTLLTILLLLVTAAPIHAQPPAPNPARMEMINQLTNGAFALLDKYEIPREALDEFLPLIANNDNAGLMSALSDYGLTEEQVGGILTEAQPLIQQGMSTGIIQDYVAAKAISEGQEAGVPEDQFDAYLDALDDPEELAAFLEGVGLDADTLDALLEDAALLDELGLNAAAIDQYIQEEVFLSLLSANGVADEDLQAYLDAFNGEGDLEAMLSEAGLDAEALYSEFDAAYQGAFAAFGFDEDELASFQDSVFLDLVSESADDPEALAELLSYYGFEDGDIEAFLEAAEDPESLGAMLGELGFDEEAFGDFMTDMEEEAFSEEGTDEGADEAESDGEESVGEGEEDTGEGESEGEEGAGEEGGEGEGS